MLVTPCFVLVLVLFSRSFDAQKNSHPSAFPQRKSALLRLTLCLQRRFGYTLDTELLEELVRRKDLPGLVVNHLCDTPIKPCLPSHASTKRKATNSDRYLASLILDTTALCGGHGVHKNKTSPGDEKVSPSDPHGEDSVHIVILYVFLILNLTGILTGFVYKYRSDCSLRSKNGRGYNVPDPFEDALDTVG